MQGRLELAGGLVEFPDRLVADLQVSVLSSIGSSEIAEREDLLQYRFGSIFIGLPGMMGIDVEIQERQPLLSRSVVGGFVLFDVLVDMPRAEDVALDILVRAELFAVSVQRDSAHPLYAVREAASLLS